MKDYNKDPRENNNNSWSNYVMMHIYSIHPSIYTYTHILYYIGRYIIIQSFVLYKYIAGLLAVP